MDLAAAAEGQQQQKAFKPKLQYAEYLTSHMCKTCVHNARTPNAHELHFTNCAALIHCDAASLSLTAGKT
jgi:hypothetical protein